MSLIFGDGSRTVTTSVQRPPMQNGYGQPRQPSGPSRIAPSDATPGGLQSRLGNFFGRVFNQRDAFTPWQSSVQRAPRPNMRDYWTEDGFNRSGWSDSVSAYKANHKARFDDMRANMGAHLQGQRDRFFQNAANAYNEEIFQPYKVPMMNQSREYYAQNPNTDFGVDKSEQLLRALGVL